MSRNRARCFLTRCAHTPLRAAASGTVSMQMTSTRSLLDDAEDLGGCGPPWVFWLVCSSDPKTTVVRRMGDPDGVQLGKRSTAESAAQHHTAVEHVQDKSCIVLPASQICWCTRSMQVQSRCVACCVVCGPRLVPVLVSGNFKCSWDCETQGNARSVSYAPPLFMLGKSHPHLVI